MPNNVQILGYIQALKDRALLNYENAVERDRASAGPKFTGALIYKQHLSEIKLLEKFIRGEQ